MYCVLQEIVLIHKMAISVTRNMWFVVVHDSRMVAVLGVGSGNNNLLWRLLEEAVQRERSDKDDLCHFKLSIAQRGILQHSDVVLR